MKDVKYVDVDGYAYLQRVSSTTKPEHYDRGITIGPPDLSTLPLPEQELKVLQEALVDARLVDARLIRGSRGVLYNAIKKALPAQDTKALVRLVLSIMQHHIKG